MYKKKDDFIQFFHQHPLPELNVTFDWLLEKWHGLLPELESLYEHRDNEQAFKLMSRGIQYFLYALYLANGETIHKLDILCWKEMAVHFVVQPVNITERLEFIIDHPTNYHSFIQLKQLYTELNKKHAVHKRKK